MARSMDRYHPLSLLSSFSIYFYSLCISSFVYTPPLSSSLILSLAPTKISIGCFHARKAEDWRKHELCHETQPTHQGTQGKTVKIATTCRSPAPSSSKKNNVSNYCGELELYCGELELYCGELELYCGL